MIPNLVAALSVIKEETMQYRHGDLLIVRVDEIPSAAKRQRTKTLAEGEATGHAHTLLGPGTLCLTPDGQLYLRAPKAGSSVVHQEHARIDLPPGNYRVVRQREYVPQALPRRVVD